MVLEWQPTYFEVVLQFRLQENDLLLQFNKQMVWSNSIRRSFYIFEGGAVKGGPVNGL
jgi:hypothetical protein